MSPAVAAVSNMHQRVWGRQIARIFATFYIFDSLSLASHFRG